MFGSLCIEHARASSHVATLRTTTTATTTMTTTTHASSTLSECVELTLHTRGPVVAPMTTTTKMTHVSTLPSSSFSFIKALSARDTDIDNDGNDDDRWLR